MLTQATPTADTRPPKMQRKPVSIDGVVYQSIRAAAYLLKVPREEIKVRIKCPHDPHSFFIES